jgi:hypothetical protein
LIFIASFNLLTLSTQLENNLRSLNRVLRETLKSALHPDTFAIASSPIRDTTILDAAIHIDQNSNENSPKANHLASPSHSKTYAVVDRTADVKTAARELVASRFAFGGSSPYAPDVVLVNEFVKQDFLQAVAEESRKLTSGAKAFGDEKDKSSGASRTTGAIEVLKKADSKIQIISQEARTAVVELVTRRSEMLETKTSAPVLIIHAIKSLDDAIDFIGSADSAPALAAYHFGNPQVGKYLAQFVDARVSFVNHIPRELLVGPAHPTAHAVDLSTRYSVDMFTLARPAFIQPTTSSAEIAAVMASANGSAAQKFLEKALSPLAEMKRKAGGGVGMYLLFFYLAVLMRRNLADTIHCRFLRARPASQCWLHTHRYSQRNCGRYCLVSQEWEDSIMGDAGVVKRLLRLPQTIPCIQMSSSTRVFVVDVSDTTK